MAVNARGEPTNGVFTSKLGVEVAIYKNWLYVHDSKAWEKGGAYAAPVVMVVNHGTLQYKDVHIDAMRGPRDGVYCVVFSQRCDYAPPRGCKHCGKKSEPGKKGKKEFHANGCPAVFDAMLGVGCYAYRGDKFVGVTKAEVKFLKDWVHKSWWAKMNMAGTSYWTDKRGKEHKKVGKPLWHRYREYAFDAEIRAIPLKKVLRFNQGDAFFAQNLKFAVPATKPGESKGTLLAKVVLWRQSTLPE